MEAPWAAGLWRGTLPLDGEPVELAAWYPAAADSECRALEYGGPPALFRLPALAEDAPAAPGGPRPLVLLCPDPGRAALDLGWLGVHLARRGCVVAAAASAAGEGADYVAAACRRLRALADAMDDGRCGPSTADASRYAVVGFDLGGIAALALAGATPDRPGEASPRSVQDARVAALALLNPAPARLLRGRPAAVSVPVHVLVSAADRVAPPEENGQAIAAGLRECRLTRLAAPAGHHVFLSEATREGRGLVREWVSDHAAVHRGSVHERSAALVAVLVHDALGASARSR